MSRENRITTVEQLDALPEWTVIQGRGDSYVAQKHPAECGWEAGWYFAGEDRLTEASWLLDNAAEYRVLWSPPVHDPTLDVSELTQIGRK